MNTFPRVIIAAPARLRLTGLAAGALFASWMAVRADRELRADLLQQTRLVAQAVNPDQVRTPADTEENHRRSKACERAHP